MNDYIKKYLKEVRRISKLISVDDLANMAALLAALKQNNGRLFIIGVGGSAANASHAVNDFRKILGIECYTPLDNVAELTARINDDGWDTALTNWLKVSRLKADDIVLVLSVGGGSENTSQNLVQAMKYTTKVEAKVLSIVSRDGGYARDASDVCVIIPVVNEERITPHAEEWQGVVWHMLINGIYSMQGGSNED